MRSLILPSAVLGLTVCGQLVIKARALLHSAAGADGLSYIFAIASDLGVWSGLAAAGLAAFARIAVLQQLEVGFAYPFSPLPLWW
jgi:hypothetical protein